MTTDGQMSVMAYQTTGNPKFNSSFSLTLKKSVTLYEVDPPVSGGLPYEGPVMWKFFMSHYRSLIPCGYYVVTRILYEIISMYCFYIQ